MEKRDYDKNYVIYEVVGMNLDKIGSKDNIIGIQVFNVFEQVQDGVVEEVDNDGIKNHEESKDYIVVNSIVQNLGKDFVIRIFENQEVDSIKIDIDQEIEVDGIVKIENNRMDVEIYEDMVMRIHYEDEVVDFKIVEMESIDYEKGIDDT